MQFWYFYRFQVHDSPGEGLTGHDISLYISNIQTAPMFWRIMDFKPFYVAAGFWSQKAKVRNVVNGGLILLTAYLPF